MFNKLSWNDMFPGQFVWERIVVTPPQWYGFLNPHRHVVVFNDNNTVHNALAHIAYIVLLHRVTLPQHIPSV